MASPTAIPHPETSAHHRSATSPDVASDSSFRPSKPSYSPPSASSIYSKASGAFSRSVGGTVGAAGASALRLPLGMGIGKGLPSPPHPAAPTSRQELPSGQPAEAAHGHGRVRSQTTTCAPGVKAETFDDRLPQTQTPGFFDGALKTPSATSTSSSYVSSADLASGSPSSPVSASSVNTAASPTTSPFQATYALGRVPSLPLGASYEQAQKRFNSGSWSQNGGWGFGSLRNGAAQAYGGMPSGDGSGGGGGAGGGGGGGVGSLLRRFSMNGGHRPSHSPEHRYSIGSVADLHGGASAAGGSAVRSSSPTPMPGHVARDSGVSFSGEGEQTPKPQVSPRGRQASISGGGKRKPSPMGERLLMGHFNAH